MPEKTRNNLLNKRVGAMLTTTGFMSRMMSSQFFAEKGYLITPEQYLILSIIMDAGGSLYQRQISEITYKDRPNVTRIINILENMGLVKRVEDVNKRKVFKVLVTEKGIEARKKIQPTMYDLRAITTKNISEEDLEFSLRILEQMQVNMLEHVKLHI